MNKFIKWVKSLLGIEDMVVIKEKYEPNFEVTKVKKTRGITTKDIGDYSHVIAESPPMVADLEKVVLKVTDPIKKEKKLNPVKLESSKKQATKDDQKFTKNDLEGMTKLQIDIMAKDIFNIELDRRGRKDKMIDEFIKVQTSKNRKSRAKK